MSVHKVPVKGGHKWEVRYRDDQGRNRSKRFDLKKGEGGADAFDDEMAKARRRGEVIDPDRSAMTVERFFYDVYLELRQAPPSTRRQWNARWSPKKREPQVWHVGKKWGRSKLRDANNREAVLRWHTEMRRAGATDASIRQAHSLFVSIISYAHALEYLFHNRVLGFELAYEPKRYEDPWLPEQIELIRNDLLARSVKGIEHGGANGRADGEEYKWRRRRDAELVCFLGYMGPRLGEAFALPWERLLNPERTTVGTAVEISNSVREGQDEDPRERTKTGGKRYPRLERHVREDLLEWWMFCGKPTTGPVFPIAREDIGNPDARWTPTGMTNWRRYIWDTTVEAVGLPKRPPKHLRHSAVSMWIREGMSLLDVANRAGHTMVVCQDRYAHAFAAMDPTERFSMTAAIAKARSRGEDDRRGLRAI